MGGKHLRLTSEVGRSGQKYRRVFRVMKTATVFREGKIPQILRPGMFFLSLCQQFFCVAVCGFSSLDGGDSVDERVFSGELGSTHLVPNMRNTTGNVRHICVAGSAR